MLRKYKYYSKIQTIHKEYNHTAYKKVDKTLLSYPQIPEQVKFEMNKNIKFKACKTK